MKYLCLIYSEEAMYPKMSEDDMAKMMSEYTAFTMDVKKSGALISGQRLQPTNTATTIRIRNGKMSTTDGPFAETKEQLGGFYLLECKDLNEAIQTASRIPGTRFGCVEVRPIIDTPASA